MAFLVKIHWYCLRVNDLLLRTDCKFTVSIPLLMKLSLIKCVLVLVKVVRVGDLNLFNMTLFLQKIHHYSQVCWVIKKLKIGKPFSGLGEIFIKLEMNIRKEQVTNLQMIKLTLSKIREFQTQFSV